MGRVDIALGEPDPVPKKELPQCSWCGERSKTVCGRCKARAYCSTECQRLDWKSGHQTACVVALPKELEVKESRFVYYHVPYVAHWAINLRRWRIARESKEFAFLLARLPDETRQRISSQKRWSEAKLELAKELAVRRMAEVLTQAVWQKVQWKHSDATGRDFLEDREHYVWTGKKYQNANMRFPNFNFSMVEAGGYLFLVTHPVALTGVYAGGPVTSAMPDPSVEFSSDLAAAWAEHGGGVAEGAEVAEASEDAVSKEPAFGGEACEELPEEDEMEGEEEVEIEEISEVQPTTEAVVEDPDEDRRMFGGRELLEVCEPEAADERRWRLRQAIVGKFAYFRTIGRLRGRPWSQVVLGQQPVGDNVPGAQPDPEDPELVRKPLGRPRRHPLHVEGCSQSRWRCDVHEWRGFCLVVCRGPPQEALDPEGDFKNTQAARYPEIDRYDNVLEHTEPRFIEVPIRQLLPEKWHSDYVRACGGGERGEQVRMNYTGSNAPHIPKV